MCLNIDYLVHIKIIINKITSTNESTSYKEEVFDKNWVEVTNKEIHVFENNNT